MPAARVVAPFVDLDGDGLADVDASGRFVGGDGQPLTVATPFPEAGVTDTAPRDALGRALTAPDATTTLYQYLDLDSTVLAGVTREATAWLDPTKDTALALAWGATALMGPRAMQSRSFAGTNGVVVGTMTYNGFDIANSAALDLLHAFIQLLGAPDADATLGASATLLTQFESPTSSAVAAMLDTSDRGKLHTEAQIPATSTVFDDLVPLIARTLRVPGLAQDLVTALQDPHVRGLAPMLARMMTAADQVDFNHTATAIGDARGAPFFDVLPGLDPITPVDRSKPDADYNRSLLQRIAHLVHDSSGVQYCNKAGAVAVGRTFQKCKLFQINDLALFFALNLASDPVRMDSTRRATTYTKGVVSRAAHRRGAEGPHHRRQQRRWHPVRHDQARRLRAVPDAQGVDPRAVPAARRPGHAAVPDRHHGSDHVPRWRSVHRRARPLDRRVGAAAAQ